MTVKNKNNQNKIKMKIVKVSKYSSMKKVLSRKFNYPSHEKKNITQVSFQPDRSSITSRVRFESSSNPL